MHRLEALLGSIIQEDDPRSQAILAELNAPLETAYGELVRPRPVRTNHDDTSEAKEIIYRGKKSDHTSEPSEEEPMAAEEENNAGNLSIDESGQLRYYGKSSGYYMLQSSKNFKNGAFHFNSRGQKVLPNPLADPYALPPADLSQHLLDLYFEHFYPLLPLVHKRSFLANPQAQPHLLLNAIYAVASRISPDVRVRSDPDQKDTAGDVFFERARILLDFEWDDYKVYTVQSLVLMSSHQNGALKNIRGWLYSGLVSRISID